MTIPSGLVFSLLCLASLCSALPRMRTAPVKCPLQNGNLIDTVLFVENSTACEMLCANDELCLFYYYYPGSGSNDVDARKQPPQCFLYDECNRKVIPATENCPLNKENTVNVRAFVESASMCEKSCSRDELCGYYKYFNEDDARQPMMCYHLKSCSPRVIRSQDCPLEVNNYIDHSLFTKSKEDCGKRCENTAGCRFYFWHPIDYSPAPLYCYLYRGCEGGADEPTVALVASGRHPGHYFLDEKESMDLVKTGETCEKDVMPNGTMIGRAGAVLEFISNRVLLCGGRDHKGNVQDGCLSYDPRNNDWTQYYNMNSAREESASVVLDEKDMFVLGGFIDGRRTFTSDRLMVTGDENLEDVSWRGGPELPESRARFCAVPLGGTRFAILGGETEDDMATVDFKTYDAETGDWVTQPAMKQARKDHACVTTEINGDKGVLVTGGVDQEDTLLSSVEFYSFRSESWNILSPLMHGRTEHGMILVGGMTTVLGGVSDEEFLSSIEVLDNSADSTTPLGMEWRIAAHSLARPRYDFAVAAIPISALSPSERSLDACYDDTVVESAFLKKKK